MNLYTILITAAAKAFGVPVTLLFAICAHESGNFTQTYTPMDKGTPSYGVCQIKAGTAQFLGFKNKDLKDPTVNIAVAAKYLRYQFDRYNGDWCASTAAYNSGSFLESKKVPGKPKNLRYVRLVQNKLNKELRYKLECDTIIVGVN